MSNTIHDLDKDLAEYFEFKVGGHQYRFKMLNTEEMSELKAIQDNEEKSKQFLNTFITPVSPDSPSFNEVSKKMIITQWNRFQEMIKTEFGAS